MRCTNIQLKATHLICSTKTCEPGFTQPRLRASAERTGDKVADAMLRFGEPTTFNRTPGQMRRGKKREGKDGGDDRGLGSVQEPSTGQWKGKKGNSSL